MGYVLFEPEKIKRLQAALHAYTVSRYKPPESAEFHAAWENLRNPMFEEAWRRIRSGDTSMVEVLIQFLEEDPVFFRSGYWKEELLDHLKRYEHSKSNRARLQAVCLDAVDRRGRREFLRYCRLAAKIADPPFVALLEKRLAQNTVTACSRAARMLRAIRQKAA
jgi:hypothetical protein